MLASSVTSMLMSDRRSGCSLRSACSCSAASGVRQAATTLRGQGWQRDCVALPRPK